MELRGVVCLAAVVAALTCPITTASAVVLTNDITIGSADATFDGEDLIVSNCTVTVNGPHDFASLLVGSGGTLTHPFLTGTFTNLVHVTNELRVLTGSNAGPLLHSNILTETIRVTDAAEVVTYTNGLDYLVIDLGGAVTGLLLTTNTAIPEGAEVFVSYDAVLAVWSAGVNLAVAGDAQVDSGGSINATGRGYAGNTGIGNGGEMLNPNSGGGAGYGGDGGISSSNAPGGISYGSIEQPTWLGSGGGAGSKSQGGLGSSGVGGAGGGVIRLKVGGKLTVNGVISANGMNGESSRSGGGAGGSIWVTAQNLAGRGTISANGGNGEPIHGGGGGGGRIAVEYTINEFAGSFQAQGGEGFQRGGAGTLFTKAAANDPGVVTVDNGGLAGASTLLSSTNTPALVVQGGAVVSLINGQTLASLTVHSNGWLSCQGVPGIMNFTVSGDARFWPGGGINVTGKGYRYGAGPGAGEFYFYSSYLSGGGGAGHAGYGGMSLLTNLSLGGNYYDSVSQPGSPGSGGGGSTPYPGGAGGGAVRLTVLGTLQLDGEIAADGTQPISNLAGAGSGGSVWLTVGALAGSGQITANGGSAWGFNGGGGSGGRIAVYFNTNTLTGRLSAAGGAGYQPGAAGTIFTKANNTSVAQVVLDNHGGAGANTMLTSAGTVDLTLQGGAVAGGATTFHGLTIRSNGFLVVSGLNPTLTVTGDARIEAGAAISLDGLGYANNLGSGHGTYYSSGYAYTSSGGGGAHGGDGGNGYQDLSSARGGAAYGSLSGPTTTGSGGGGSPIYPGGAGGGALRLIVNGLLQLEGRISADGQPAYSGGAGGGAGGSVWLTLNRWAGSGLISVKGGNGDLPNGGGGGGGRIAVTYQVNSFAGRLIAYGGVGYAAGGAGTIYVKDNKDAYAQITLDNGDLPEAGLSYTYLNSTVLCDLTLRGGAALYNNANYSLNLRNLFIGSNSWCYVSGSTYQTWTVASNAIIEVGAGISGAGLGYPPGQGPGSGRYATSGALGGGGGGAHGGSGGNGALGSLGGTAYDSFSDPTAAGSGGGGNSTKLGGAGGGALRLTVNGLLRLDGLISVDGGSAYSGGTGGGSGGSLWLNLNRWVGNGVLSANGGMGDLPYGGGGGGGRMAITYVSNAFTGTLTVRGGSGMVVGGAGTLFTKSTNDFLGALTMDNGGSIGAVTPVASATPPALIIRGGAVVVFPSSSQTVASLEVYSNSWLYGLGTPGNFNLTVNGDARFWPGSGIDAVGKGYAFGTGTGAGIFSTSGVVPSGGGGGHAGYGGMGSLTNLSRGGNYYGSVAQPSIAGSGGGGSVTYPGGAGGGAVRLNVLGKLLLDGSIAADGAPPPAALAGAGSGGCIWLTVGALAGRGQISATGGAAHNSYGGGGSGGRIAVYYDTNGFMGSLHAAGGTGFQNGAAGTIYTKAKNTSVAQVVLDNGGAAGTNTFLTSAGTVDLTLQGGAVAGNVTTFHDLTIRSNSLLVLSGPSQNITVSGDALIEAGASLSMDGLGNAWRGDLYYYNSSISSRSSGGGEGHGGEGGSGAWGGAVSTGGSAWDSLINPTYAAGGGGNASSPGGSGGGALHLTVGGLLQLEGRISADGRPAYSGGAGGGAGGGLSLTLNRWAGSGVLSANGGAGDWPNGGGGGGGRIAVTCISNSFSGAITTYGGAGHAAGGAGTIYLKVAQDPIAQVTVDNGGQRGASTVLNSSGPLDLAVRGGGCISNNPTGALSLRNLYVGSNSWCFFYGTAPSPWTVTGQATIEAGGGLSAEGRGYGANLGTLSGAGRYNNSGTNSSGGGGGHGGYGGNGFYASSAAAGGSAYETALAQPVLAGSGGGRYSGTGLSGSAGGGVIHLTVNGALNLDGAISVNGLAGMDLGSGGGAGGSAWLSVGRLSGSGFITADGGSGDMPNGGGGGGGRIAVYYGTNSFTGAIMARGGYGANGGGAGTIYTQSTRQSAGQLIVDNDGQPAARTLVYPYSPTSDLIVKDGAMVVFPSAASMSVANLNILANASVVMSNQTMNVTKNATVDEGGALQADGTGYGAGSGPAPGSHSSRPRGGGSHGGLGGANASAVAPGSATSPVTWGSGGGNGSGTVGAAPLGGSGGGAVRLTVYGILTVDGRISADGAAGGFNSGGGAGGSVWLSAGTLVGQGMISAQGGGGDGAGGGGGGRVAIEYHASLFRGAVAAFGGDGAVAGGAGTICWFPNDTNNAWLVVDNGGTAGANTPLVNLPSGLDLTVANGAIAHPQSAFPVFHSVNVGAGGLITTLTNQTKLELATTGDLTIQALGALSVDGKGYPRGVGPGAGQLRQNQGGGGGYGGAGGFAASGAPGGGVYGSETQPLDRGSGGNATGVGGSDGGGAIRLSIGGQLNLGGSLTANGNSGWQDDAGGGAGGSVWITAGAVAGDGLLSALGGDGEFSNGGGGGGGRIALYTPANTFTGLASVAGGLGAANGKTGTLFVSADLPGFRVTSQSPSDVVSNAVDSVVLTFNEVVDSATLAPEDFVLNTPAGLLPQTNLTVSALGLFSALVTFPLQNIPGDYHLVVGPNISDLFGRPLAQVYTGTFMIATVTIGGTVTNAGGNAVAEVVLQPDGGLPASHTDAHGSYVINVPPGWSGTVTPSLDNFVFVPRLRSFTNVLVSLTSQDFLMVDSIKPTLKSGLGTNLWLNWTGVPGVAYQVWASTNLVDWYPAGDVMTGANGLMETAFPVDSPPIRFFWLKANN